MAIYHCAIKTISKGKGQSAIASASYRSGTKLIDHSVGVISDYTNKGGVVHEEIMLPHNAPQEYSDRETLWNEVHKIEKAKDSQLAREVEVALPREFDLELQTTVLKKYIKENFVDKGMCADFAIHDKGDGNPHAHIMLTMRSIKDDGSWASKSKKVYILDEDGNKIYTKTDSNGRKQYKSRKEDYNDWNKKENVEVWRSSWANCCNEYLEKKNQIDHRSFERQGIELEPTIHEGYVARQMEKRGEVSEVCEKNRQIKEKNKLLQEIKSKIAEVGKTIADLLKRKNTEREEIHTEKEKSEPLVSDMSHDKDGFVPFGREELEIYDLYQNKALLRKEKDNITHELSDKYKWADKIKDTVANHHYKTYYDKYQELSGNVFKGKAKKYYEEWGNQIEWYKEQLELYERVDWESHNESIQDLRGRERGLLNDINSLDERAKEIITESRYNVRIKEEDVLSGKSLLDIENSLKSKNKPLKFEKTQLTREERQKISLRDKIKRGESIESEHDSNVKPKSRDDDLGR